MEFVFLCWLVPFIQHSLSFTQWQMEILFLFYFVCVCVCMCVRACMCSWGHMHVCACQYVSACEDRSQPQAWSSRVIYLIFFFARVSHRTWNLPIRIGWPTTELRGGRVSCLCFPSIHFFFFKCECWDSTQAIMFVQQTLNWWKFLPSQSSLL